MIRELAEMLQRLNLSHPQNFIGEHFPEILSLLAIVFGGSFLLFAWKQRNYFLGITGFLVGGWAGLLLKGHVSPQGDLAPYLYLAVCAVAGAFLAITMQRFVGMLLGGFSTAMLMMVFVPDLLRPEQGNLLSLGLSFLLGGGLGAIFPRFFFVFNASLIGAVFVTYGVSEAILTSVANAATPELKTFLHLAVFLPLLLFGMIYQLSMKDEEGTTIRVEYPEPRRIPAGY